MLCCTVFASMLVGHTAILSLGMSGVWAVAASVLFGLCVTTYLAQSLCSKPNDTIKLLFSQSMCIVSPGGKVPDARGTLTPILRIAIACMLTKHQRFSLSPLGESEVVLVKSTPWRCVIVCVFSSC